MASYKSTAEERKWMVERFPTFGSIGQALDEFEKQFGNRPSKNAVYQWAHRAGVHIGSALPKKGGCATIRIIWKSQPELMEWMRKNGNDKPVRCVMAEFEREFGFPIAYSQVTLWRQQYGHVQEYRGAAKDNGRCVPVGSMRRNKCGTLVKVRERPSKPGTKDNWEYLHHIIYRETYGEIPPDHQIVFLDHDNDNLDPANLYAIPNGARAVVNGFGYHDRDSMEFALAQYKLKRAIVDHNMKPQVCKVCGNEFTPWRSSGTRNALQTCRDCLDHGRMYISKPKVTGKAICAVCGQEFDKGKKSTRRCPACIAAKPKWAVWRQAEHYERTGQR